MSQKDKAIGIVKRLRDEGYESYLAGGCVRDMVLGKMPQDYDISTNAKPDEIARIFPQHDSCGCAIWRSTRNDRR